MKYVAAQGTGVLHYTQNELVTDVGQLSGSRLAVVGAELDSNVFCYSVFNDAYQQWWSLQFAGYSNRIELQKYAEQNDGNIERMLDRNVGDDSVRALKVATIGQARMDRQ